MGTLTSFVKVIQENSFFMILTLQYVSMVLLSFPQL